MEQLFDVDSSSLSSKRPAESDSSFERENKRSCLRPLDDSLSLNPLQSQPWIGENALLGKSYVLPPPVELVDAAPESAWKSPLDPDHPLGYADSSINLAPFSLPFSDLWRPLAGYGSTNGFGGPSGQAPYTPPVQSTPFYLEPAGATPGNAPIAATGLMGSREPSVLDTIANSWGGFTCPEDFTAPAYQLLPESGDSLHVSSPLPDLDTAFTLVMEDSTFACASWGGDSASPLVKVEEAVVDMATESIPVDSPSVFAGNSITEATTVAPSPSSAAEQKKPISAACSQPDDASTSDSGDDEESMADADYDTCFGVVSSRRPFAYAVPQTKVN